MKLVSYRVDGAEAFGVVSGDGVITMSGRFGRTLREALAAGAPEGVGHRRNPPLWMKAGDVLEVEITGIGVLRTRIVDERA